MTKYISDMKSELHDLTIRMAHLNSIMGDENYVFLHITSKKRMMQQREYMHDYFHILTDRILFDTELQKKGHLTP